MIRTFLPPSILSSYSPPTHIYQRMLSIYIGFRRLVGEFVVKGDQMSIKMFSKVYGVVWVPVGIVVSMMMNDFVICKESKW